MTYLDVPTQPLLQISTELNQAAWDNRSSSSPAWWNTYLNQVCLQTVVPWLESEFETTVQTVFDRTLWQLVNGTALTLASHRLIVIPEKAIETSEFRVPQEWIDLPSFAGDYYLAAQVDPDDASILIWGYTTHEQLKTQGRYDANDRVYCLDAQSMIQDLTVLNVVRELAPQEVTRAAIAALTSISAIQAEQLIQRLATSTVLRPRLAIPFQLWGALLENSQWRQQLGQLRLGQSETAIVRLSRWLQNTIDEGWQTLETLLGNQSDLAYQFRTTAETSAAVQRIKVLEFGEQTYWLFVGIEPEEDERFWIRVQLRSAESDAILPSGATLALLATSGSVVQSVTARDRDNGIQLRRFRCSVGTQFNVQISVDSTRFTEEFTV
ncbi:DUF1822 family protein [Pseudanabaenaceae cyanobacterium LEGE 13415]|nr:DUF1822 family protein [Pseudanabaenaceae cyanobacterium LEGE 13415]